MPLLCVRLGSMTWRGGQNSSLLQLTAAFAIASILAAACTGQAEQTPASDEGTDKAASSTVSSSTVSRLISTTTLERTLGPADPEAEAKPTPEEPGQTPNLTAFATTVGAETVVAQVQSTLYVYQDGHRSSLHLGPMVWAWSDGDFIYQTSAEGGFTFFSSASLLNGTVVCETDLPMHHATERNDGTYVMAVTEQEAVTFDNLEGQDTYPVPAFAVDCQTGDSQAIDPFMTYGIGETGYGFVKRVAGREFTGLGDNEGNADMVNEQDISLNGDDYAGYHTFSPDGSMVAYGDFTNSGSPHYTTTVRTRDTNSGELLWEKRLDMAFSGLHFFDDHLLVELIDPAEAGLMPSDSVVVLDRSTGAEVVSASLDFELLYVGM